MAEKKGNSIARQVIKFSIAVAILLVLKLVFLKGLFISVLMGLVGYIVAGFVLPSFDKSPDDFHIPADAGISASEAKRVISESTSKVKEIRAMTMKVRNNQVAEEIRDICKSAMDIIENFKKDPKDIKKAKQFINYYLDSTVKIVTRYVELSETKNITPEIDKSLKKVEGILQTIRESFERQLEKLLQDDLLDLDVEVEVLERTMRLEG
ncbi:MAG TPA: 5-bromo-4-chloroindolyl phosphate hydrolysis family protein [Spirochaetota bacterium]|nr:5-bromo-4-chloroindolyl phosphate hydrolysis family protein [Spirochaetota bacterium]HQO00788.1 5-bromo-4-chloroindolyl phosphate hydrolysis family protein [Spirochaetota bacterium]HQP49016.1 5-bromo-4-chloroindolyl phosphate hydrolysis family protein [Spirochaetota bacterium]